MRRVPAPITHLALILLLTTGAGFGGRTIAGERILWSSEDGSRLGVEAWAIADVRAFPRTEVDYGKSWNVEPALASARLRFNFQTGEDWGARLDGEFAEVNPDVQEAWFEFHRFSWMTVRAGRIKVPFGNYTQRSAPRYDMISAPMFFGNSKDFKDIGVMITGEWENGYIDYTVAGVTGSRDISINVNEMPDVVGRVLVHAPADSNPWLRGLRGGVSGSWGEGPTRQGFRGRTPSGHSFANPPEIRGAQFRLGAELGWDTPYFSLLGEWTRTTQDRKGVTVQQRVGTTYLPVGDLEAYRVEGWYAEGTLRISSLVTGPQTEHAGFELSLRFETLDFGDGQKNIQVDAGVEDHAPEADSDLYAPAAALHFWPTSYVRLSIAWQGILFDDATFAPDYEGKEAVGTSAKSAWFHQFFLRAQFEL